jgi:hypothetical protein
MRYLHKLIHELTVDNRCVNTAPCDITYHIQSSLNQYL